MELDHLRKEYRLKIFSESCLEKDPMLLFEHWMNEAVKSEISDANAMILATAAKNGQPSCRTVLLKQYDGEGLVFFTNYQSKKAIELEENPLAALIFYWRELERQVCMKGRVEKVGRSLSEQYFSKRSRGSQLGAWASLQDSELKSREELEASYKHFENLYNNKEIPLPPYWGGYRFIPAEIEFWQGRENRLHDRFLFTRKEDGWKWCRLSP